VAVYRIACPTHIHYLKKENFILSYYSHPKAHWASMRKSMSPTNRRIQGKAGEDLAARFLESNGFNILERNYHFERGEIDLVAEEGDELVFIEVKARNSTLFGAPEEAVTEEKQEQVRTVADGYLFEHDIDNRPCRFDVVAIEFKNGKPEIRHIRDSF
jgi:putative endonuclease